MSRQLQEFEATMPDKQALASVLKYLKQQNLKGTEEALKKELGIHGDVELDNLAATVPSAASLSGAEPAKYEESYSSEAPFSSTTTTTKADLQPASTTSVSSPALDKDKRSFSWPGSLSYQMPTSIPSTLFTAFNPIVKPATAVSEAKQPNAVQLRTEENKTPLWVNTSQQSTHTVVAHSGSPSTGVQIPFGTSFIYQVAATPQGFGIQQPVVAPLLTVLPTGLLRQSTTTTTTASTASTAQPVIFNAAQRLGLPFLTKPQPAASIQQTPVEKVKLVAEPSTGQALMSPEPPQIPSQSHSVLSPPRTLAAIPPSEMTPAFSELRIFAEEFKTKRIRLGYTQGAVGQSLAEKGYSNFAQSTISRFEQMQLSPTNAAAIKQVLEKWLQDAESPTTAHSSSNFAAGLTSRKRKKRAVFTPQTRNNLEEYFRQNPRPNRQVIEAVAHHLDLLPEEVRVWFCNKRQKEKGHSNVPVMYHNPYDREATLSTASSETNSPSSLYDPSILKQRSPSPKTSFTIEELSKSSANSSASSSPTQLVSPFASMSPSTVTSSSRRIFPMLFAPSPPGLPKFVSSFTVAQTRA